jgi:DNA polymerase III epsilon subunit-like protein
MNKTPKILCLDIETFPLEIVSWGIHDQNINQAQILKDWSVLSWAACWVDEPKKVMYADVRNEKDVRNDKNILKEIHKLMSSADIILGQNSNSFDIKKLNTRFFIHNLEPIKGYRTIDTKKIAKKNFAFTTASLAFMNKSLGIPEEKMKNEGLNLWLRCLKGDKKAFKDIEKYNKQDVVATVALFKRMQAWDNSINFNLYTDGITMTCNCGSSKFKKKGFAYTASGRFQRYRCLKCGAQWADKVNLLTKEKKKSLMKKL